MRNSDTVLYSLSEKAKNNEYVFERLYRNLYNVDFYLKALGKTYANTGAGTKGSDGNSIDGFSLEEINNLIELLKEERYQPTPLKRVYINKKNNTKKKRPLGIPSYRDKVVQEIVRMMLESIYEPSFSKYSHGFRPMKSCHTALKQIRDTFKGVNWFIEGDIKGCFDNIDHNILINILKKRINDEKLIRLIYKFLRCGYIEDWKYKNTYSGTPQGGIISPILANVYLNELDMFMESLRKEFDTGDNKKDRKINPKWGSVTYKINKVNNVLKADFSKEKLSELKQLRVDRSKLPYWEPMSKNYKRLQYVRYADDFIIGVIGSKEDAEYIKSRVSEFIKKQLNMELSEDKTLITHSLDRAKFLGYEITKIDSDAMTKDKNGVLKTPFNGMIDLYIPKNTIREWLAKNKIVKDIDSREWRMNHRTRLLGLSDLEIIQIHNSEIRGLYNYYKMAKNVHTHISTLIYALEYSCLGTLANKHKTSKGKIKERYRRGQGWGVEYETSHGKKFMYFFNEPVTRVKSPFFISNLDNTYNLMKIAGARTQLEDRLRANMCELCGYDKSDREYEVHHVKKVKDLKGKEPWEKLMIARKRKTLILCKYCHSNIHKGKR